jgi:hypothetical protein
MSDTDKRYEPIRGNPVRSTKSASSSSGTDEDPDSDTSSRSTRRVSVTPQDWDKVEALAEEFGLPYSKVYNMGFNALLEKLGRTDNPGE